MAVGFTDTLEQQGQDQTQKMQTWREQRLVVRSLAFAASQEQPLRQRVARAMTEHCAARVSTDTICRAAHWRQGRATLKGIYPGQPGRQTTQPTTAMMLWALRGVTLLRMTIDGKRFDYLTPLNAVPKRILVLMEVPLEIYTGLVT